MNPLAAFIAPLALLLPGAVVVGEVAPEQVSSAQVLPGERSVNLSGPAALPIRDAATFDQGPWAELIEAFRTIGQAQVRIEQRLTIRITPRAPELRPDLLAQLPSNGIPSNLTERRMGRCVPVAGIAGVQMGGDSKLILFMRDQRIVSATLEKSCRSRDFYSGFYVARSEDGLLCTGRDELQSRAGANCRLTGLRQLIDDRDD